LPHIHLDAPRLALEAVDVQKILGELVATLSAAETVSPAAVKAYATARDHYVVGDGHTPIFVHCMVSLLEGRPLRLRQQIGQEIRAVLLKNWNSPDVSCTVEVREMNPETYLK
jgi:5-carboxymethyl-2-hydroxymuconate isomerase